MDGTEFEEKAFNQVKKSISEKAMAYFNKDWGFTSAFPPPPAKFTLSHTSFDSSQREDSKYICEIMR